MINTHFQGPILEKYNPFKSTTLELSPMLWWRISDLGRELTRDHQARTITGKSKESKYSPHVTFFLELSLIWKAIFIQHQLSVYIEYMYPGIHPRNHASPMCRLNQRWAKSSFGFVEDYTLYSKRVIMRQMWLVSRYNACRSSLGNI